MKTIFLVIILQLLYINILVCQDSQKLRYERIKKTTVKIYVDNNPMGSGFILDKSGLIGTNWHVIAKNLKIDSITNRILSTIQIEFYNAYKQEAFINKFILQDQEIRNQAIAYDFCLLSTKSIKINSDSILRIGEYNSADIGSEIIVCGYPFGLSVPIITRGYVSTKTIDTTKIPFDTLDYIRQIAYLDVSQNSGNSGGPVVLIGDKPENDQIIGISTFNVNPYAKYSEIFEKTLKEPVLQVGTMNVAKSFLLVSNILKANSLGLGGLISIEYLNNLLKE